MDSRGSDGPFGDTSKSWCGLKVETTSERQNRRDVTIGGGDPRVPGTETIRKNS